MMKRLVLLLLVAVAGFSAMHADDNDKKKREQMMREVQEFKIKFIAQEIELTDAQKERFVQLYNEMSEKRNACMSSAMKLERKVRHDKNATDADYQKASEAMSKARAEDLAIEKEYDKKFEQFLSSKQIFKMKNAENKFRDKMQQMRQKHKQNGSKKEAMNKRKQKTKERQLAQRKAQKKRQLAQRKAQKKRQLAQRRTQKERQLALKEVQKRKTKTDCKCA